MLLAAFHVFVDRGIAASSMEEIAQRAGVGKGTLYLEDVMAPSLAALREVLAPTHPDHRLADLDPESIHHALVWPLIGGALHAQLLRSAPPRSTSDKAAPRSHARLVEALLQPVGRAGGP